MSRLIVCLAAATLCLSVSACETPSAEGPLSPVFGLAVASMNNQIVNPGPPSEEPPEGSAARGDAAIRRYEAGRVRPLENSPTSKVSAQTTTSTTTSDEK